MIIVLLTAIIKLATAHLEGPKFPKKNFQKNKKKKKKRKNFQFIPAKTPFIRGETPNKTGPVGPRDLQAQEFI